MNIDDVAFVFEGMAKGLGAGLKAKDRQELQHLADMFRRFPSQSVTDFKKFVEGCFLKERNSIPVLIERAHSCMAGNGEPLNDLLVSVRGLGAGDVSKLLKALGQAPQRKKEDNLTLFQSLFSTQVAPVEPGPSPPLAPTGVEEAFQAYCSIRDSIDRLSLETIRSRFQEIAKEPKPVLAEILHRLGFSTDGTKEDLSKRLLSNLESVKVSRDQTSRI